MARPKLAPSLLWRISVTTSEEAEEAVFFALENLFGANLSVYLNVETRQCVVSAFAKTLPEKAREAAAAELKMIESCGLNIGEGTVEVSRVKKADWAESWKKHFKPLVFGSRLLVKPSWSRRAARPGQAVVVLDPGLSFGTGQHATTSFCLRQLVKHCRKNAAPSFLDMGTGSGILAICAAKLGYAPVRAFDFDPQSVRVASANARKNRVDKKMTLSRRDLRQMPRAPRQQFDFICANLMADLLLSEREAIVSRLKPGGRLALAGILISQFPAVQSAYEQAGLRLSETRVEREWQSGAFVWSGAKAS